MNDTIPAGPATRPIWPPTRGAFGAILPHLGLAFLFTAMVNVLFLASPLYMMQLYGRVLNSRSLETLISLSIALLIALIAMAIADAARGRLLTRAGARIADRLAGPGAAAALTAGKGEAGAAIEDLDVMRKFLGGGAAATLMDAPFTLLFLFVLFLLHPMLGLVASLGALAILAVLGLARLFEARRETRAALSERRVGQMAAGLRSDRGALRALGLDHGLAARLAAEQAALNEGRQASGETAAVTGAATRFLRLAAHSGALATGAVLAIDGALAPSAMLAAAILAGRALGPIEALPGALRHARLVRGAMGRTEARLETAPVAAARPVARGGASIDARRLVAMPAGATRAALRSISFTIAPGEIVSVAGPAGSGKSTLLRCLAGAERPRGGELRVDGIDLTAAGSGPLAGRIGWLPQEPELHPGTVAENIARFVDAAPAEIHRAAERAGALSAIERLPMGFDTEIDPAAGVLSPGLRQSIAFARALIGTPGLVLLDQPTAHMDAAGEVAALNAIRGLGAEGVTVLVASHKPVMATIADRLMLIEDGMIGVFEDRETVLTALRRQSLRPVGGAPPRATEQGAGA